MVSQVLAHAGKVGDHGNAQALQMLSRADAGEHEGLRGADGPGAENYLFTFHHKFLAAALHLDAGSPIAVENNPVYGAVGADAQVNPVTRRVQVP